MPPKPASFTNSAKKVKVPTEGTRRSARSEGIKAAAEPPKLEPVNAAPKKKRVSPKEDGDDNGEPKGKKIKPTSENKKKDGLASVIDEEAKAERGAKKLSEGDILPEITLKNEKDEDVNLADLCKERGLVIFTYPRADTPGCTNQACLYRDFWADFDDAGYSVIGLSKDKPAAHARWIAKKSLNYSLFSDPTALLIKPLGCNKPGSTTRSHFIFEKGTGKLLEAKIGVKPATDSQNALEFIRAHHA